MTDDPNSVADALADWWFATDYRNQPEPFDTPVSESILNALAAAGFEVNPAGTADRLGALTAAIGDPDELRAFSENFLRRSHLNMHADHITGIADAAAAVSPTPTPDNAKPKVCPICGSSDDFPPMVEHTSGGSGGAASVTEMHPCPGSFHGSTADRGVTDLMAALQASVEAARADRTPTPDSDPPPAAHNTDGTESMTGIAYCTVCGEDAPCSAMTSSTPTPDDKEPTTGLHPASADEALTEVERRLRDTEWSSYAEDRCRMALLHIDAYREGKAMAPNKETP